MSLKFSVRNYHNPSSMSSKIRTAEAHSVLFCFRPNEVSGAGTNVVAAGAEGGKLRCPAPISRLRVEKIEGGLMVAGVVVAANCQIILPIFGFLFLLVGCVLTGKFKLGIIPVQICTVKNLNKSPRSNAKERRQ